MINKNMLCDAAVLWAFFAGGYCFLGVVLELHFPDNDQSKNIYVVVDDAFRVFIRTDESMNQLNRMVCMFAEIS